MREITLQSPPFTYIVYRITRPGAGLRACTLQPSRSSRIMPGLLVRLRFFSLKGHGRSA